MQSNTTRRISARDGAVDRFAIANHASKGLSERLDHGVKLLRQQAGAGRVAVPPARTVSIHTWDNPSWLHDLNQFFLQYGHVGARDSDRVVSQRTKALRKIVIESTFRALRDRNRGIHTLSQLTPRTIPLILEAWGERDEKGVPRQAPSTQVANFTVLRWFWRVHGIQADALHTYVTDPGWRAMFKRTKVATKDKSWKGNGIDVAAVLEEVRRIDPVVARLLELARDFGLRAQETLCLRPHEDDTGEQLRVTRGTKTGRPRAINYAALDEDHLRAAIAHAKEQLEPGEHAAWMKRSLKQAKTRLYVVLDKAGVTKRGLGVTMHGLRAQFAIENLERMGGVVAPVRGGKVENYRSLDAIRGEISRALGHNRLNVGGAYYGSFDTLDTAARNRFKQSWASVEPVLDSLRKAVVAMGATNAWLVGARARGEIANYDAPFELLLDLRAQMTASLGYQEIRDFAQRMEDELKRPVIVYTPESATARMKACWKTEAVPLVKAQAPVLS